MAFLVAGLSLARFGLMMRRDRETASVLMSWDTPQRVVVYAHKVRAGNGFMETGTCD